MGLMILDSQEHRQAVSDLLCASLKLNLPVRLRVEGRSMYPFLRPGDMVLVDPVENSRLRRGDVVVVLRGSEFFIHRLLVVGQQHYLTKGDGEHIADSPSLPEDIVGVVQFIERGDFRYRMEDRWLANLNRLLGWLGALEASGFAACWPGRPFRSLVWLILWLARMNRGINSEKVGILR